LRILLIQPDWEGGEVGFRLAAMPEPLALELLAASVPNHELRLLDMRIDRDFSILQKELETFAPDVVALTALTTEVYFTRDVIRQVRRFSNDLFIVIGGHHVTLMSEDFFMPEVDAIILGEGEVVFPKLIEALSSNREFSRIPSLIFRNDDGEFVNNGRELSSLEMDELPLPRRDLTERYRSEYFFLFDKPDSSVATGRGCPYRCNFCSVWEFYKGKTRQMSASRVVEEVKAVDTSHITFVDDNFLMNYKREDAIADLLQAEGIKMRYSIECRTDSIVRHPELVEKWVDTGLYAVLLGLEGASDKALANVNKKNAVKTNTEAIKILQDNGVIIWGAFLVDPQWEADDFKQLRDYVNQNEITHTQFTILTPLPGTELYRQKFGELLTYDYTCFDTMHSVLPTKLPREEFYQHFANLYQQNDLGPYYDLLREGKLSLDDCRRGKQMLDTMSESEYYFAKDPILGNVRSKSEALPGAILQGQERDTVIS